MTLRCAAARVTCVQVGELGDFVTLAKDASETPLDEILPETLDAARHAARQVDAMEAELHSIADATKALLSPVLSVPQIRKALAAAAAAHAERGGAPGASMMLLLDARLAQLPVELLPALGGVGVLARDFSIHVLHHRLVAAAECAGAAPGTPAAFEPTLQNKDIAMLSDPRSEVGISSRNDVSRTDWASYPLRVTAVCSPTRAPRWEYRVGMTCHVQIGRLIHYE